MNDNKWSVSKQSMTFETNRNTCRATPLEMRTSLYRDLP